VYDMYPWDTRADSPRTRPPAPRNGNSDSDDNRPSGSGPGTADPATLAVQVALDRRDNGGDAAADAHPAPLAPATAASAGQ
jgi:hypothetical protein